MGLALGQVTSVNPHSLMCTTTKMCFRATDTPWAPPITPSLKLFLLGGSVPVQSMPWWCPADHTCAGSPRWPRVGRVSGGYPPSLPPSVCLSVYGKLWTSHPPAAKNLRTNFDVMRTMLKETQPGFKVESQGPPNFPRTDSIRWAREQVHRTQVTCLCQLP